MLFPLRHPFSPPQKKAVVIFIYLFIIIFFTGNPISLPGIGDSEIYVNTVNTQYHDDAEDFLYSEVLSNYGDLLVSFSSLAALQNI